MQTNSFNGTSNVLLPPGKAPEQPVFDIEFSFAEEYHLDVNVHQVSDNARLAITADGVEVFSHYFIASDNSSGDWVQIDWNESRNVYESISNRDYWAIIPAGTNRVVVEITDGDWLSVNSLRFTAVGSGYSFDIAPDVYTKGVIKPLPAPDETPVATSESTTEQASTIKPVTTSEQARTPETRLAPPPKRTPWVIGAAASAIAVAAIMLAKKRRR